MKRKEISRRKFITLASLGTVGSCVTLHAGLARAMMGSGGMGGGGTTVIDPPPGAPFHEPGIAVRNSAGVYEITVQETKLTLNGTVATLLTYNGSYPGPAIRASQGETLRVRLINALPKTSATNILGHTRNITNLHTHGLHVSPSGLSDNMMRMAAPGEMLDYVYDLTREAPGHLNFYHPHVHGTVAEQYWGGLAGPLIINDPPGSPLSGLETHVMFLKDITISNGQPEPYTSTSQYMRGKEGSMVMVNGQVNPVLPIRPGQVQRWQIVNACTARFFKLSLDRHSLYLVGTDGGLLDKPYQLSSILLAPGERIDVLVKANQGGGSFKFLSLPYDRGTGTLQQVTLLTLSYSGPSTSDTLPASVNPAAARPAVNTSSLLRRQMTLSMMMGKGYINGISFNDMDHAYRIDSKTGTYEVWQIVNQSGMDHPFHQHVNSCQVLSITGGDSSYASLYRSVPAWKDVVIVPKMGSATLLVPVEDYDGMTMFHCHIIEHEDIGMMGVWNIGATM
jgi:FtsP/CotA-like multicopper oxidase with cupredoxin domain